MGLDENWRRTVKIPSSNVSVWMHMLFPRLFTAIPIHHCSLTESNQCSEPLDFLRQQLCVEGSNLGPFFMTAQGDASHDRLGNDILIHHPPTNHEFGKFDLLPPSNKSAIFHTIDISVPPSQTAGIAVQRFCPQSMTYFLLALDRIQAARLSRTSCDSLEGEDIARQTYYRGHPTLLPDPELPEAYFWPRLVHIFPSMSFGEAKHPGLFVSSEASMVRKNCSDPLSRPYLSNTAPIGEQKASPERAAIFLHLEHRSFSWV
ncbi:hypothetical protein DFS33DRAFT_514735 [Desarmillaria ectypa]|nr:hypothetical protein DFS33DRAFT_514735 [Desarmillaria ectypa]